MTPYEITENIRTLKELELEISLLEARATSIRDALKEEMQRIDQYELSGESGKVTWHLVVSNRFNQSSFKQQYADLYESFKEPTESRRFLLS